MRGVVINNHYYDSLNEGCREAGLDYALARTRLLNNAVAFVGGKPIRYATQKENDARDCIETEEKSKRKTTVKLEGEKRPPLISRVSTMGISTNWRGGV